MSATESTEHGQDQPHRRRVRYSGTHPKRFAEKYKEHDIKAHPELREHLRNKGKTPANTHIPILVAETMTTLKPSSGEVVADCTLGYGGHAVEFARRIGLGGKRSSAPDHAAPSGHVSETIHAQRIKLILLTIFDDIF